MTDIPNNGHISELTSSMTDDDLREMLRRASRTVVILAIMLFFILTITEGWQSGVLMLAGAFISWTGIHEWRNLALAVFARIDNQQNARPMARTLVMFFLRLVVVGGILYVSLRYLKGSIYALVAGLALAVVALSIEALRLLRE